jgi:CRISPR/Cas system CSM-associated protein Csm3 (group 7 of RAMP superfamily)
MKGIGAMTLAERLLAGSVLDANGCRLWQKAKTPFGYGEIRYKGKKIQTHRAAWIAFKGPIPPGKWVLHKCDVPACIHEDHLFLGTHFDNMRDAALKGRMRSLFKNNWRQLKEAGKVWRSS